LNVGVDDISGQAGIQGWIGTTGTRDGRYFQGSTASSETAKEKGRIRKVTGGEIETKIRADEKDTGRTGGSSWWRF
jgi:hypothetical protein